MLEFQSVCEGIIYFCSIVFLEDVQYSYNPFVCMGMFDYVLYGNISVQTFMLETWHKL